jgi:hypothetical protein
MEKSKTMHLEKPNTLSKFLSEKEQQEVVSLKISGPIGRNDIYDVLDGMCETEGYFDDNDDFIPDWDCTSALKHLDLGEATYDDGTELPDFGFHSHLESIVFPKGVEKIGDDTSCFSESDSLKSITLPDGLKTIGGIQSCPKLTDLILPDSMENIISFAFCGCKSITSIRIPALVKTFDGSCFAGCGIEGYELDSRNPYFTVVDGVVYTKDLSTLVAFPSDFPNKHFNVPDSTRIIGFGAFMESKIESITLPDGLLAIEGWAFQGSSIKGISIPDSVKEVGKLAFRFCERLEHIGLPNGLTNIPDQLFYGCPNLHTLHVPASVKTIEGTNFAWSHALRIVEIEGDTLPVITGLERKPQWSKREIKIVAPNANLEMARKAPGWNRTNIKIQDNKQ